MISTTWHTHSASQELRSRNGRAGMKLKARRKIMLLKMCTRDPSRFKDRWVVQSSLFCTTEWSLFASGGDTWQIISTLHACVSLEWQEAASTIEHLNSPLPHPHFSENAVSSDASLKLKIRVTLVYVWYHEALDHLIDKWWLEPGHIASNAASTIKPYTATERAWIYWTTRRLWDTVCCKELWM